MPATPAAVSQSGKSTYPLYGDAIGGSVSHTLVLEARGRRAGIGNMSDQSALFGATVYLVSCDALLEHLLRPLITAEGATILQFASAREYLLHCRRDRISCLIVDVEICDLNGLPLQQYLSMAAPPSVFVGGPGDLLYAVRAMKAGALEFLARPVDSEQLKEAIFNAVARDRELLAKRTLLADLRHRFENLTSREREVMPLLLSGLRNKQAAWQLGIREVTLQVHRGRIMRKMRAGSFAELVRMGETLGVGPPFTGYGSDDSAVKRPCTDLRRRPRGHVHPQTSQVDVAASP